MQIHIYKIYFPTSNRICPYYVGQTAYLERRMARHLNSKYLIGNALRKYDDWQITILHATKNRDVANLLEIEEIRNFNCVAPNGYNITRGGEGGDTFTDSPNKEERREKIIKSLQGNQHAKGKNLGGQNAKGYKHTEEWKKENGVRWQGKNNPMKNSINIKKMLFSRYMNKIKKYEQELKDDNHNG